MMLYLTQNAVEFTDEHVVKPDDVAWVLHMGWTHYKLWFLSDSHSVPLAVVAAESLGDALDEAADAEKLDRFKLSDDEATDERVEEAGVQCLGNRSDFYDIESVTHEVIPLPKFSLMALLNQDN